MANDEMMKNRMKSCRISISFKFTLNKANQLGFVLDR